MSNTTNCLKLNTTRASVRSITDYHASLPEPTGHREQILSAALCQRRANTICLALRWFIWALTTQQLHTGVNDKSLDIHPMRPVVTSKFSRGIRPQSPPARVAFANHYCILVISNQMRNKDYQNLCDCFKTIRQKRRQSVNVIIIMISCSTRRLN